MTNYIYRRIEEARENEKKLVEYEKQLYDARMTICTLANKIANVYYHGGMEETEYQNTIMSIRIDSAKESLNKAYSLIHDAQLQIDRAVAESKKMYQKSKFMSPADIMCEDAIEVARKEDAEKSSTNV